jgi:hypothetical protein
MSLTVAGIAALGLAASKGHDMYLAGCDVLGADDEDDANALTQAVKLQAMQQTARNAGTKSYASPSSDDGMSASAMLMIAGGVTVGVLALGAVLGRK